MQQLYAEFEPFITSSPQTGDGHTLYFDESGNPKGKPVVVFTGGPGSGTTPWQRRLFDPDTYRIVLFDHRGC